MIYDTLNNRAQYIALGRRFALGFSYLERFDPHTDDGHVAIEGDDVFASVQSYIPTTTSERLFEAHRVYADLQYIAAGEEVIQYAPLELLQEVMPYSNVNDASLYKGDDDFPLYMRLGRFAIFFPNDGHKPCCLWRGQDRVKKVVVKIRL
jgi:YhcH/YjgK/YiaL family protein